MIRAVESSDIAAVLEIYNYYIAETVVSFEEEAVSLEEMRNRIDEVTSLGFPWLVAEEDETIIGYAYGSQWKNRSAYKHSAEVTVYLSPLNQSNGWGTKLYQALFLALKKGSMHSVIAGIALPNPASVALHEKFGMVKVAHFKEIGFKFNEWVDTGYWQGELSSA